MSLARIIINDHNLTSQLLTLMKKANEAIMLVYHRKDKDVKTKNNQTPVTEADLLANAILKEGLKKIFPQIPIVSEEDEESLLIAQQSNIYWLIDPLDGTKEFINKNQEFTCNVALIENKINSLGFVSVPAKDLIYFGGKDFGSKCIDKYKNIRKLKCNYKSNSTKKIVASKNHLNKETKEFINNLKEPIELVQAGSSLKFIKIAEGLADIYPRLAPTSEWDTAAAHAVLEGAGGKVTKLNGENISYGKSEILNPFFIATRILN